MLFVFAVSAFEKASNVYVFQEEVPYFFQGSSCTHVLDGSVLLVPKDVVVQNLQALLGCNVHYSEGLKKVYAKVSLLLGGFYGTPA